MSHYPPMGGIPYPYEHLLEYFVCHCANNLNLGYTTIKLYLCGVKHFYLSLGYGDITHNMCRLNLTLRGIKKATAKAVKTRIPLTTDLISNLHSVLAAGLVDTDSDILLWAAICVGFFAGLRCGEFTVKSAFNPDIHLCKGDVIFAFDSSLGKAYCTLTLRASKTDPFRQGCQLLLYATGHTLCPITALQAYMARRTTFSLESPLFCLPNGTPLTRKKFIELLRLALEKAGLPSNSFCGHSLRRGFATSLSLAHTPETIIQTLGRWSSNCYKRYIDTPKSVVANAQQAIACGHTFLSPPSAT